MELCFIWEVGGVKDSWVDFKLTPVQSFNICTKVKKFWATEHKLQAKYFWSKFEFDQLTGTPLAGLRFRNIFGLLTCIHIATLSFLVGLRGRILSLMTFQVNITSGNKSFSEKLLTVRVLRWSRKNETLSVGDNIFLLN